MADARFSGLQQIAYQLSTSVAADASWLRNLWLPYHGIHPTCPLGHPTRLLGHPSNFWVVSGVMDRVASGVTDLRLSGVSGPVFRVGVTKLPSFCMCLQFRHMAFSPRTRTAHMSLQASASAVAHTSPENRGAHTRRLPCRSCSCRSCAAAGLAAGLAALGRRTRRRGHCRSRSCRSCAAAVVAAGLAAGLAAVLAAGLPALGRRQGPSPGSGGWRRRRRQ